MERNRDPGVSRGLKLLPPKLADWTEGHSQIGVFVRTRMGSTIEYVNDNLDTPGAREEIRGMLSPFLGDEAWPEVNAPSDGKEVLRPHSRAGWWEVWSGEICIALLKPEDVAKFLDSAGFHNMCACDYSRKKEVPRVWIDEDGDEGPVYKWHVVVDTTVVAKYENKRQAEYTVEAIRKSFPFFPPTAGQGLPVETTVSPKQRPVRSSPPAYTCQDEIIATGKQCGKPALALYWDPDGKLEAILCGKHDKIFRAESAKQVARIRKRGDQALRKLGYQAPETKPAKSRPKPKKSGERTIGSDMRHRQGER